MAKVNLDALIPREDFGVEDSAPARSLGDKLKISDLVKGQAFFYSSLRKPDFQRETSDWDKEKIASFIQSFLDDDLIPAIILWQAGQYTFVIDGAHRLSALIAWANDDYGDGFISQAFFNHEIDSEQKRIAEQTKRYVDKAIGSYKQYIDSIRDPSQANPSLLAKANKLGFLSVQLQWVSGGSEKAESSFFTINQKATPINETEILLLKARKKPHAMASRAILRAGSGHKYWKGFSNEVQVEIQETAKEINESIFTPEMKTPVKTLDLPLAGKGYSANSLSLVFDLVKQANEVSDANVSDDPSGLETIKFLNGTRKVIRRFTSTHASSLGLHPAVYVYSEKGRHQPTALMAWIEIVKDLEKTNGFTTFTKHREATEKLLIRYKNLTNQVTLKHGSGAKGYKQVKELLLFILALASEGVGQEDAAERIKQKFPYLNTDYTGDPVTSPTFSQSTKSEIFISAALASAPKCGICRGYVHVKSISIDHVGRKRDGGVGEKDNGQIAHPYCNTTYKQ